MVKGSSFSITECVANDVRVATTFGTPKKATVEKAHIHNYIMMSKEDFGTCKRFCIKEQIKT